MDDEASDPRDADGVDPATDPGDDDRLAALKADSTAHGFHDVLGFELAAVGDGWARARVPYEPDYVNPGADQAMHGGVTAATLDAVVGYAVYSAVLSDPDRTIGPTMSLTVNYVATASEPLVAVGEVIELGSQNAIAEGEIRGADSGELIATASGVWRVFETRDEE